LDSSCPIKLAFKSDSGIAYAPTPPPSKLSNNIFLDVFSSIEAELNRKRLIAFHFPLHAPLRLRKEKQRRGLYASASGNHVQNYQHAESDFHRWKRRLKRPSGGLFKRLFHALRFFLFNYSAFNNQAVDVYRIAVN
jgi:hypothetical protein